ncbi:hypothetical protein CNR22_15485 [Sphingobacteriaceae bacterium]|nr:hypothetical protein CNR22_15485 [Sphingobacteriaceae bacterium]
MKHFFLIALALLASDFKAARIIINGNVQHTKVKSLTYSFNRGVIRYEEVKKTTTIDKKGNFKIVLDLSTLTRISIVIDEQYTSLHLQPGDSIGMKIDYLDFDKSIVFSGKNSSKNNFEKEFGEKFILGHESEIYQQNAYRKAVPFANYCDSMLKAKLHFTDTYREKLDPVFATNFKKNLMYANASDKLDYPGMWVYLKKLKDTLPEMPYSYFDFVKEFSLDTDSLLKTESGFDFLKSVCDHYGNYLERTSGKTLDYYGKMQIAESMVKNERNLLAYNSHLVLSALEYGKFVEAEKIYLSYELKNPNSMYLTELKDTYTKIKSISPGQNAPAFTLLDDAGKKVSLSDFKGKIIYLDFWASWCGPCVRELAFSKKIKPEYEGKDIVFLYISIDEDEKSWKNGITKNEIHGVNLIAPSFDNALCDSYNVKGIPSYFLIGRDGKIIDNNPPRPSEEEALKKLLTSALEK